MDFSSSDLKQVLNRATTALRACYREQGIIAGPHHFTDYWARDGYFAALGSLEIGDQEIVEQMVKMFFSFQREDGLIPYRIMRGPITLGKYFGQPKFYKQARPTYRLRGFGQEILDGTTLSVLFAAKTKQINLIPQIKQALVYLESKERNGLLWDGPMAEWNDAVWKYGYLLYSNLIYWKMYQELSLFVGKIDPQWSEKIEIKQQQMNLNLHSRLWNGRYFADWHDYKRQDYFYPFGNCLAIVWGLTNQEESKSIFAQCENLANDLFLPSNTPKYPFYRIDLLQRLSGMADYQNNGILWWQPVTTYLKALQVAKRSSQAQKLSESITNKILADQEIYECYEKTGQAVRRKLYMAEHPFAWASGMLIWSLSDLII